MRSIRVLVSILGASGLFIATVGFLVLTQSIFTHVFSLRVALSGVNFLIVSVISLCLAYGLSKREKWAWYSGLTLFTLGTFQGFLDILFESFIYIISLALAILCFVLLIQGRKQFFEQPRERISQWFRKPCFVIVFIGTLIVYIIVVYLHTWRF